MMIVTFPLEKGFFMSAAMEDCEIRNWGDVL